MIIFTKTQLAYTNIDNSNLNLNLTTVIIKVNVIRNVPYKCAILFSSQVTYFNQYF